MRAFFKTEDKAIEISLRIRRYGVTLAKRVDNKEDSEHSWIETGDKKHEIDKRADGELI